SSASPSNCAVNKTYWQEGGKISGLTRNFMPETQKQDLVESFPGAQIIASETAEHGLPSIHLQFDNKEAVASTLKGLAENGAAVLTKPPFSLPRLFQKGKQYERVAFFDLARQREVIEYRPQDQMIQVESGITLSQLDDYLAEHDQWFPISYY